MPDLLVNHRLLVRILSASWPVASSAAIALNCVLLQKIALDFVGEVTRFRIAADPDLGTLVIYLGSLAFCSLSLFYWISFGTASRGVQWVVLGLSALYPMTQVFLLCLWMILVLLSGDVTWLTQFVEGAAPTPFVLWAFPANTVLILLRWLLERLGFGDEWRWWEQAKCWWMLWSLPVVLWSFGVSMSRRHSTESWIALYSPLESLELLRVVGPVVLWTLGLIGAAALVVRRSGSLTLERLDRFWRLSMVAVVFGYPVGMLVLPVKMSLFPEWRSMVRWLMDSDRGLNAWMTLGQQVGILAVGVLWWIWQRRKEIEFREAAVNLATMWVLTLPVFATFASVLGMRGGTRDGLVLGILWTAGEVLLLLLVLGWNRWRTVANDEDDLISRWAWASLGVWSVGTAVAVVWFLLGREGADRLLPPFILSLGWLQYSAFEPWLVRWAVYALLRGVVFAFSLRWMASPPSRDVAVA